MKRFIQYTCFFMSLILSLGVLFMKTPYNSLVIACELVVLSLVLFSFQDIKANIAIFFFIVMMQFFLLNRPLIDLFEGNIWWDEGDVLLTLTIILLSLYGLYIGASLGNIGISNYKKTLGFKTIEQKNGEFKKCLQTVSKFMFYITIVFSYIVGGEKIFFRLTHSYVEYYALFSSKMPHAFEVLALFSDYALFVFLSSYPEKRKSFLPLCLYFLASIPELLIGRRNPIMLKAVFIVVYFVIRDFSSLNLKWVGKREKKFLLLCLPVSFLGMGIIGMFRNSQIEKIHNIFDVIINLFYDQGITFYFISKASEVLTDIGKNISFTFGGIIDYFQYGGLARLFLGAGGLENGNNLLYATRSNNLAHRLSYILLGDRYLAGEGTGTSYILEVFIDFGYIGIIIFNIILGIFLVYGIKLMQRNFLTYMIGLMFLTNIFFLPRGEATGFLISLFLPYFWLVVLMCYVGAHLLNKKYFGFRKIRRQFIEGKTSI